MTAQQNEEQKTVIKVLRLNTGEDIVGNCLFDDESQNVLVEHPMKLVVRRYETGQTVLYLLPWLPIELLEDQLSCINYGDIITIMNPKNNFMEYYTNNVTKFNELMLLREESGGISFGDEDDEDEYDEDMSEEEQESFVEMMQALQEKKNSKIH